MGDDKSKRGPPDNQEVDIHEPYELRDWAHHWNVSKDDVIAARNEAKSPWADKIEAVLQRKGLLTSASKRVRK